MRRDSAYTTIGPDYHWQWWANRSDYRNWMGRVLSEFPKEGNGAHVLDIGCGDGVAAAQLVARGYQVCGVDYLEEPLNVARERVPEASFVTDFPDKTFDYVLVLDALYEMKEHPDLIKAVQNCQAHAVISADPAEFSEYAIQRLFTGCSVETVFEDDAYLLFIVEPQS